MSRSNIARLQSLVDGPARQNAFGSLLIQGSQRLSRLAAIIATAAWLTPASFDACACARPTDLCGTLMTLTSKLSNAVQLPPRPRRHSGQPDAKTLVGLAGLVLVTALAVVISAADTVSLIAVSVWHPGEWFRRIVPHRAAATLALHSATSESSPPASPNCPRADPRWLAPSLSRSHRRPTIGDVLLLALVSAGHGWRPPAWRVALAEARAHSRLMIIQLAHIAQFRVGTIIRTAPGSAVAVAEYSIASRMTEGLILIAAALTSSSLPLMGAAHTQTTARG